MKPNLNDTDYLEQLSRAVHSASGRIIIQYLQTELEKLKYEVIDTTEPIENIGYNFLAIQKARTKLSDIIRFLTR